MVSVVGVLLIDRLPVLVMDFSTNIRSTSNITRTTARKVGRRVAGRRGPTAVSTILTPLERVRVDVTAAGAYTTLHRDSLDQIVNDLRQRKAEAVLVSVSYYNAVNTARMAAMVREFPRVPAYALLTDERRSMPQSVLSLGQVGVRTLIDARQPSGWSKLRELLMNEQANDIQRMALGVLNFDLIGVTPDCWRFFEILFAQFPHVSTVREVARRLNVLPSTLLSRFYRAQLPSPKDYIDFARLIRAARLLENTGLSVSAVSRRLDYSSPQAFSRHVRSVMQLSPVHFRRQYTGQEMLDVFRERFIVPHLSTLRTFHPVSADPGWLSEAYSIR